MMERLSAKEFGLVVAVADEEQHDALSPVIDEPEGKGFVRISIDDGGDGTSFEIDYIEARTGKVRSGEEIAAIAAALLSSYAKEAA